jgi:hypothetical protein
VRRAPPVVRRLLPHRLALAAAVLTVTLAAALLAALASFAATVGSYAVHSSLAGNPGTAISITASASSPAAAARADSQVRASLRGALPGIALTVFSSLRSDYLVIPAALGGPNAETHVISLDDLPGHAILVAGTWPGLPGGSAPVAVAVPSSLAGQLHLAPGALIKLRGSASGAAVAVRVSGIFRPLRPDSSYWSMDPPTAGPQRIGGFTVYGPGDFGRVDARAGHQRDRDRRSAVARRAAAVRARQPGRLGRAAECPARHWPARAA